MKTDRFVNAGPAATGFNRREAKGIVGLMRKDVMCNNCPQPAGSAGYVAKMSPRSNICRRKSFGPAVGLLRQRMLVWIVVINGVGNFG